MTGANAIVTSEMSHISIDYKHKLNFITLFPTESSYQWYYDIALTYSNWDLKDPLQRLGIINTPEVITDLNASSFFLEAGISRRQSIYDFMDWILGARVGTFASHTSGLSGQTQSSQTYSIDTKTDLGLSVSAYSGVELALSRNYNIGLFLMLRRHYMGEFTILDRISGVEAKYPGFTTIGFGFNLSRGF